MTYGIWSRKQEGWLDTNIRSREVAEEILACHDPEDEPEIRAAGPLYPQVHVQLTGRDGNAGVIIGAVMSALRREVSGEAADAFASAAMQCESYDALLQLAMTTVDVS